MVHALLCASNFDATPHRLAYCLRNVADAWQLVAEPVWQADAVSLVGKEFTAGATLDALGAMARKAEPGSWVCWWNASHGTDELEDVDAQGNAVRRQSVCAGNFDFENRSTWLTAQRIQEAIKGAAKGVNFCFVLDCCVCADFMVDSVDVGLRNATKDFFHLGGRPQFRFLPNPAWDRRRAIRRLPVKSILSFDQRVVSIGSIEPAIDADKDGLTGCAIKSIEEYPAKAWTGYEWAKWITYKLPEAYGMHVVASGSIPDLPIAR